MQAKPSVLPKPKTLKLSVTVRGRLKRKYREAALDQIDAAIQKWINKDVIRGIRTVHVAVDDSDDETMKAKGVKPVSGRVTASKVKRVIDNLWERLNPDYLVIFGGHDVIPMFKVDNPLYQQDGDDDKKVLTDNPYASSLPFLPSLPGTYLVPDRVIGRITDMLSDGDPAWFLEYLATATDWKSQSGNFYKKRYAISCSAWRKVGLECIDYIGKPASHLFLCPPTRNTSVSTRKGLSARVHMIRCHGWHKNPAFYGQKKGAHTPHPRSITSAIVRDYLQPATVVATTSCYGAQIFCPADATDKKGWPVASAYLRKGAFGFVGSTMSAPFRPDRMDWSDWIVSAYLRNVLRGSSIGRAFLDSKIDFAWWLVKEHNGLGTADEKILIAFVLLGDPSIHPVGTKDPHQEISLAAEERRQRRVARELLADETRKLIPSRSGATKAERAMAKNVFKIARSSLTKSDIKELNKFGVKSSTAVRVQKLNTALHDPKKGGGGSRRIRRRQSLEYYWSGRMVNAAGQKQIRVLKAETDPDGNLWRTAVIYA